MDAAALVVGMVFPDRLLYGGDNLFRQFTKEVGGIDLRVKISQVDKHKKPSVFVSRFLDGQKRRAGNGNAEKWLEKKNSQTKFALYTNPVWLSDGFAWIVAR